jgi:DNA primase
MRQLPGDKLWRSGMLMSNVAMFLSIVIVYGLLAGGCSEEQPLILVSEETTWIMGPIDELGMVDYVSAMNQRFSEDIDADQNAMALYARVIGLDPDDNPFHQVIETACVTKEVLDAKGLPSYCKTSGSSGLHIYLPLEDGYSYDEARDFTKFLCYHIQELVPKLTSMERSIKKRGDKIYLDFMQNRKGQTLAAAYCVRPVPGARVSAPLKWEEVKNGLKKEAFTIKTMPERLEKEGDLFRDVLKEKNDIAEILGRFE